MAASSVTALKRQSLPSSTTVQPVDDGQAELPLSRAPALVNIPVELVRAKKNKGAAFTLACDTSGLDDKEVFMPLGIDKAVFSRIKSGSVNLDDDLLAPFCRIVGNRIYAEWLAYQVGCQLVEIETETARQLRVAREQLASEKAENALLRQLVQGRAA
jgi:hypothetical protein